MRERLQDIANALRECAASWDSHVRLLGGVRAYEIVALCDAFLATPAPAPDDAGLAVPWAWALMNTDGLFDVEEHEGTAREWARAGADLYFYEERHLVPLYAHPPQDAPTVKDCLQVAPRLCCDRCGKHNVPEVHTCTPADDTVRLDWLQQARSVFLAWDAGTNCHVTTVWQDGEARVTRAASAPTIRAAIDAAINAAIGDAPTRRSGGTP